MLLPARSLALVLFALCMPSLRAQELHFQHLTKDDGLSDNGITCFQQDTSGAMWIGTESGVDLYDGQAVQPLENMRDRVSALLVDREGVLWVGTSDHGLARISGPRRQVVRLKHSEKDARSIACDRITALYDLNDTTVLIGTQEVELMFCDKRTLAISYWSDPTSLSPARATPRPTATKGWCHAITPLNDDLVWIGFLNVQRSLIADRRTGRVISLVAVRREGSETNTCALLLNDTVYTGGWQNDIDVIPLKDLLHRPQSDSLSPQRLALADETLCFAPWSGGRLIAGTRSQGLMLIDPMSGARENYVHVRSDPSSLISDRVRCVLVDARGALWVGTANGLSRYEPRGWEQRSLSLFPHNDDQEPEVLFHRLERDDEGGLRVFSSEGFFLVDSALREVRHVPVIFRGKEMQPTYLLRGQPGNELLGTEHGLLRYDRRTEQVREGWDMIETPGMTMLAGRMFQVRGLWPDTLNGRGIFVIGAVGFGVQVFDALEHARVGFATPQRSNSSIMRHMVNGMVRAPDGTYWAATSDGLIHWNNADPLARSVSETRGRADVDGAILGGEDLRQVMLFGDTLWVLSRKNGLYAIHENAPWGVPMPEELRTNMHGFTRDARGRFWITTDEGLLRCDPHAASWIKVAVGIGSRDIKASRAITTLADGRIALCADDRIITFDPRDYERLPTIPVPYVTGLSAAGVPLKMLNGAVQLSYRASVIDIGISALSFDQPAPLRFDYRLEGVETGWRSTDARTPIRYAGIPVGEHRLLVRVRDAFGRISEQQVLLTVSVSGPLWQRWWFYALLAVAASAAAFAWSRYQLRQALKLQAVRNSIASDLHDEVGSSLSSITIGSELAARLSEGENEKVKHIMARIGETSSESLRSMSDIVWAIDPKNDEGEALVKRMRRIADELLTSTGINVTYSVEGRMDDLKLPMSVRKELVLIFKEAVHNASKYSKATAVAVTLHRRGRTLTLRVEDNGIGFDPALHPDGHGLGSMKRRAAALGTTLELKSTPGAGTAVGVVVELGSARG